VDPIFELIKAWCEAGASLLLGEAFVIMAVAGYPKGKHVNFAGVVLGLSVGTEFVAVGVLHLLNLIHQKWIWVNFMLVLGILYFMEGTGILSSPMTGGMRKWLAVAFGAALILGSVLTAVELRAFLY